MIRKAVLSHFLFSSFFILLLVLAGCGGGGQNPAAAGGTGTSSNPPPQISVSISPISVTLTASGTQQFKAVVTGSSNTTVQWQVNGATGGSAQNGTISTEGLYTAPNPGDKSLQATVTAVANANPTKQASANVTVNPATGTVTVKPTRAALTITQTQQFSATATGFTDPSVTWSVDGVDGGNSTLGVISKTGLYTPPSGAGTHTVSARSNFNPGISASASVWITDFAGMITYHADQYRRGVNSQELALSSTTVNQSSFGKLFSYPTDGQIYAQPLYVANLNLSGIYHNVVYVATEHDGVYAFDADGKSNSPLWYRSFIDPTHGISTLSKPANALISPEVGITSTPAIDTAAQVIYVLAETVENGTPVHRLHALDLTTGNEKFGGPVQISGTYAGTTFTSADQLQRAALLFLNGNVYIAFGSHGDHIPYEGWLFSYSASGGTLHQVAILGTAPTAGQAAIWMSGGGPAADGNGNLYVVTGNGNFNLDTGDQDAGNSFLKLSPSLQILDYYTPNNWSDLNTHDWDLGSGGVILPPSQQGAATPNLVICGGKDGLIYVVNRDNMGHFSSSNDSALQKVALGAPEPANGNWFTPAVWQNWIYFGATDDSIKQYQFTNGLLGSAPVTQSAQKFAYPGATPTISTDSKNGIVWVLDNSAYFGGTRDGHVNTPGPAVLHAYRADNLGTELYNSSQAASRDTAGTAIKFTVPTVANGHAYVGGAGLLTVYGVLP